MKNIIALDIGTSSTLAALYRDDGAILYSSGEEYHSIFPKPFCVEHEPLTWALAAEHTLRDVAEYIKKNGLSAEGIAVTSQRSSLIPVDAEGNALRNAIMWQDKRTISECDTLRSKYGMQELHKRTGLRINPFFVLPKILWLRHNENEIYQKAHKFIGVQDYVVHHLTEHFVTDWTQASRTMLMDLETFKWDDELLSAAGITADRLCELIPPGDEAAGLSKKMAEKTGLPEGLPVIISGGDQQNAAVALGVVEPGVAEANTGTGSFVISYADKPIFDDECRVVCQASAIPGKWIVEAGIFNTGAIFRWFKEQCCSDICGKDSPYVIMCDEAAASPIGASGVILLPHFEGSAAPYWDPISKGVFFNLSLGTRRADMLRAILEGISMEIADNLELIQKLVGRVDTVSVAGGMTRSDLFCNIQANTYARNVKRYRNPEQSSLGASMVAAPALGVYGSIAEAFQKMSSPEFSLFGPEQSDVEKYRLHRERKRRLYYALHDSNVFTDCVERE